MHQIGFIYETYSRYLWSKNGCVVSPQISTHVGAVEMNLEQMKFHKILIPSSCCNQTPKVYEYVHLKPVFYFILIIQTRQP
jgi:hypothetical protein